MAEADECERGDSNPHVRGHQLLRLARLPVPPLSRVLMVASVERVEHARVRARRR